mgnify:CR=1 FL=1
MSDVNPQTIYLKDKFLNITHNIKTNPYTFTSEQGSFDNRFEIVYLNETLSNPDFSLENEIRVVTNEFVNVYSTVEPIESIIVYNVLGQKLKEYNNVNANSFKLTSLQKNNTTLLLKIKLQNELILVNVVNQNSVELVCCSSLYISPPKHTSLAFGASCVQ